MAGFVADIDTPPDKDQVSCGHDARPEGELTTSFLSICAEVKDNRLLPEGYLPLEKRKEIARALGAGDDLAEDAGSTAIDDDPDYRTGGGDSLEYVVAQDEIDGTPASVRARLYYQATPPFYLQDRFCTATGPDAARLYYPGFPIWVRLTRFSVPRNRPTCNPVSFGNDGHAGNIRLRADWLPSHPILRFVPCSRHTRPVAGEHRRESVDHAGAGSGLSRSMRRRMSANRSRGMATSAIWNVT